MVCLRRDYHFLKKGGVLSTKRPRTERVKRHIERQYVQVESLEGEYLGNVEREDKRLYNTNQPLATKRAREVDADMVDIRQLDRLISKAKNEAN